MNNHYKKAVIKGAFMQNPLRLIQSVIRSIFVWIEHAFLAVPIQAKIIGIGLVPIAILGLSIDYWITSGLSDWLSYLLIDARVHAAMEAGQRSVTLVTVLSAAMSIFVSIVLTFILTRPILALREMAQRVADGELDVRAKVWAKDEIGQLATAVNVMTDRLVSTQKDLSRTNRMLSTINQIALTDNGQSDIHDVLYKLLEKILATVKLQTGWVYLLDPERKQFHLASWYGVPPEMQACLLHQPDAPLCQCQNEILQDAFQPVGRPALCGRLEACACTGMNRHHLAIPLEARGQKFGVLNLLVDQDADIPLDDMDLLAAIGSQVSEMVANAWLRMKLKEKEIARQVLLESLVKAQEEERGRLARELHDGAGQTLTSLLVRMKTLEKSNLPERRQALENMQEIVSQTIEEIREISYRLRPVVLEQFGLPLALQTLTQETAKNSGLQISCQCQLADADLPEEIEMTLYRIAQEGLTNVLKHANARSVKLELRRDEQSIHLCIEDDGIGFDPNIPPASNGKRHLGLLSMQERAEILGGTVDVYTAPGQGTALEVVIPLYAKEAFNS
jgi:signal transduction histidine kinase